MEGSIISSAITALTAAVSPTNFGPFSQSKRTRRLGGLPAAASNSCTTPIGCFARRRSLSTLAARHTATLRTCAAALADLHRDCEVGRPVLGGAGRTRLQVRRAGSRGAAEVALPYPQGERTRLSRSFAFSFLGPVHARPRMLRVFASRHVGELAKSCRNCSSSADLKPRFNPNATVDPMSASSRNSAAVRSDGCAQRPMPRLRSGPSRPSSGRCCNGAPRSASTGRPTSKCVSAPRGLPLMASCLHAANRVYCS